MAQSGPTSGWPISSAGSPTPCDRSSPGRWWCTRPSSSRCRPARCTTRPSLSIAGRLPTATFEIFRQTIPAGLSSDMQRHHHETVHYVISGDGHSEIEDETAAWSAGDFIYTPPWTWHRHYNDSADAPVEFLTIENSRLLSPARRRTAAERRAGDARRGPRPVREGRLMNAPLPAHVSIWGELGDVDHELRHVDVGGVRTRVLRAGSGPDLILLHGTGGHLEAYARDIAGLAADFRVTAYDMVGHGWSDLPDRPYTIDVLSDHLIGLMDALGIARAHLSGESLGGWVAAWTAAHHPDRVDRLVLNTPGNIANKPEVMARMRDSTLAAVRDPSDATVRRRVEFLFHHKEMVTDELVNLRRAVYGRDGFLRAIGNTLVLQDPEVRKDFAWDPSWVGKVTAPDPAAVDRARPDRRPRRGRDAARLAARRPAARDRGRGPLAAVGEAGGVPRAHRDFLSSAGTPHERGPGSDGRERDHRPGRHLPFAVRHAAAARGSVRAGRPVPGRRRPGGVGRGRGWRPTPWSSSAPTTSTRTSTT